MKSESFPFYQASGQNKMLKTSWSVLSSALWFFVLVPVSLKTQSLLIRLLSCTLSTNGLTDVHPKLLPKHTHTFLWLTSFWPILWNSLDAGKLFYLHCTAVTMLTSNGHKKQININIYYVLLCFFMLQFVRQFVFAMHSQLLVLLGTKCNRPAMNPTFLKVIMFSSFRELHGRRSAVELYCVELRGVCCVFIVCSSHLC